MLATNFEIILKLIKSKNNKIAMLEDEIRTLKNSAGNLKCDNTVQQSIDTLQNCQQVIAEDITTNIDYFRRKLKDVDLLIEKNIGPKDQENTALADKLISHKNIIIGEYYFNNMIANNLSGYKCNKMTNY